MGGNVAPDIYAGDKAKIKATDWGRVHVEGDRRPGVPNLWPRLGRYRGEGMRRERGALKDREVA